ncbi:MAG: phosphoribosylanthranilate isomerase [Planctomycetota bacterium]
MFRIKICGVRLKSEVDAVASAGADAVGFNFFPRSIRYLSDREKTTRELSQHASTHNLLRVGVFVNETARQMLEVADRVGLDAVQLHGDESLGSTHALQTSGLGLIRAVKLPRNALDPSEIDQAIKAWSEAGFHVLLDADGGKHHGGSGKTLHWESVRRWAEQADEARWTLAGGLKPENVASAIEMTGASSIDTASGVECPRGVKNASRIHEFVSNATQ